LGCYKHEEQEYFDFSSLVPVLKRLRLVFFGPCAKSTPLLS